MRCGGKKTLQAKSLRTTELLAQRKCLLLVRRTDLQPVDFLRLRKERHVGQPSHKLLVLDQKWHFMGPHFQHRPRTLDVARTVSKSRIEETRIVNAKLTHRRIKRDHFSRKFRGDANPFLGRKNIKITRLKNHTLIS